MSNVTSIAVKRQNSDRSGSRLVRRSDQKGAQGLSIWRWDLELLIVLQTELRRTRNVRSSAWRDISWVDELTDGGQLYA